MHTNKFIKLFLLLALAGGFFSPLNSMQDQTATSYIPLSAPSDSGSSVESDQFSDGESMSSDSDLGSIVKQLIEEGADGHVVKKFIFEHDYERSDWKDYRDEYRLSDSDYSDSDSESNATSDSSRTESTVSSDGDDDSSEESSSSTDIDEESSSGVQLAVDDESTHSDTDSEPDSDSEDEGLDELKPLPPLAFSDQAHECFTVFHGDHYVPKWISHEKRSRLRKENKAGQPTLSFAAAGTDKDGYSTAIKLTNAKAIASALGAYKRAHTRAYYGAMQHYIATFSDCSWFAPAFESPIIRNVLISASESPKTASLFGAACKGFGQDSDGQAFMVLNPEYDASGAPKKPYIGELSCYVINTTEVAATEPFFALWENGNRHIGLDTFHIHGSEVAFHGYIPGKYNVLSVPIRVPSFQSDWNENFKAKYGLTKTIYKNYQIKVMNDPLIAEKSILPKSIKDLLEEYVIPQLSRRVETHLKTECEKNGIQLVSKAIDASPSSFTPMIWGLSAKKQKQHKQTDIDSFVLTRIADSQTMRR